MRSLIKYLILSLLISTVYGQNRALYLDGHEDYITLPGPVVDSDVYTIESWVLMFGDAGGIEHQNTIFNQGTDVTGCYHSKVLFHAMARADLPNSTFGIRTEQGCFETATGPYPGKAEWHHIAGVKDYETLYLYTDGQLIATGPITQQGSFSQDIDYTEIGRHRHDGQTFGSYFGLMDEIRIWDSALSQQEIQSRMNSTLSGGEESLVAYWNFDNDTADDLTGNGHNGILEGEATTVQTNLFSVPANVWGDLNDDGQLNISDVIILIDHILGY